MKRVKTSISKKREEARQLYLAGEMMTNAEIAAYLKVKPHTVAAWRKEEDWDGLRRKLDRQAAEAFLKKIMSDRVEVNFRHYRLWDLVVSSLMENLKSGKSMDIEDTVRVAGVLDKAQKGQRLAKGIGVSGETEEQIRADAQAQLRGVVDVVFDAVIKHVPDEQARDEIRRALLDSLPSESEEEEDTE